MNPYARAIPIWHSAYLFLVCATTALAAPIPGAAADFQAWVAGSGKRLTPASFSRDLKTQVRLEAFRNEIVSTQMAIRSSEALEGFSAECAAADAGTGNPLPCSWTEIRYPGYVLVDEIGQYVSDPLLVESPGRVEANTTEGVWLTVHVPKDAAPGTYTGRVIVHAGRHEAAFAIHLRVLDFTLPDLTEGAFYLNIWQAPEAVARFAKVPLWSDAHWKLLEAYARDLAAHGQGSITATVLHDPWRSVSGNAFPSMVQWSYPGVWEPEKEAKFKFDYAIFDRYVELLLSAGIKRSIHCYSMVNGPGDTPDCDIGYLDTESGQMRIRHTTVGDASYRKAWGDFLPAFVQHLKSKGWLDRTYMGFDEKPQAVMNSVGEVLRTYAPELKVTLAGGNASQQSAEVGDLTIYYDDLEKPEAVRQLVAKRRGVGPTTFYTACAPYSPNVFLYSPHWEARMLPWISWQHGLAGYLRWAYCTWPDSLWTQPRFTWHSGDMYFVYPGANGPIASTRWELLREGIQDYEALRILKSQLAVLAKQPAKAQEVARFEKAMHQAIDRAVERNDCETMPDPAAARQTVNRLLAEAKGGSMSTPNPYTSDVKIHSRFSPEGFTPDGNLEKPIWKKAEWVRFSHDMSGHPEYPESATEVASFWTANYVYFAFRCKYTTLNIYEGEDAVKERWELWNRDVVEVFINPEPVRVNHYYEFEVAPNNQWLDLEIDKDKDPFNDARWDAHFDHSTRVDEKNKVWTCEMRIPTPPMGVREIKTGSEWRGNFFRADGPGDDSKRRFLCWSTIPEGRTFHAPTRFGIIQFVK